MDMRLFETDHDILSLFEPFSTRPFAWMLYSAQNISNQGRYSYIGSDPFLVLTTQGSCISLTRNDQTTQYHDKSFWELLSNLLTHFETPHEINGPPFQGGAIGHFGYELGMHQNANSIPDSVIAFYDRFLAFDHSSNQVWACAINLPGEKDDAVTSKIDGLIHVLESQHGSEKDKPLMNTRHITSNFNFHTYRKAVLRAKQYIRQGDIYQVNIAQQFKAHYEGNDYELFKHISEINPEPYTAFFSTPQYVLSLYSPECFMKITERRIISRPIKGTRPRSIDPIKDHQLAQELLQSQKDEAELLMIVDLVRNDLGKVCQYGSVHVTELNRLETHPHVHHLVATVEGTLNEGCHHLDALKALFPGGSITGAPKKRSMEIIHEIEPDRRNIYTGAFGYVGFNQRTELAMIIRNLMRVENTLTFYAGSGIVADSEPLAEYEETLEKAKHIFTFLDPNNGEKTIFTR